MKRALLLLALSAFGLPTAAPALLPAPTGVEASVDSCWGVRLSWDDIPEADSFYVRRDSTVFHTQGTVFRDTLAPVGLHSYYVAGVDTSGIGDSTSADGIRREVPPPPATVTASDTSCSVVRLDWSASAEADSYVVFRNGTEIALLPGSVLFHLDAPPPGEYEYGVEGANECGRSAATSDSGAVIPPVAPPATVAASVDSCGFIRVDWSSVPGAATYRVRRDDAFLVALADTVLRDSSAAPGPHVYEVRAVGPCGPSVPSAPAEGIRLPDAPPAPAGVAASDSSCDHVILQWDEPADTDSFRVYRNGLLLASVPAAVHTYRDTVAAGGYEYGVEAGNRCGWSPAAVDSGTVPLSPAPPPNLAASTDSCGLVRVDWTAAPFDTAYALYRDTSFLAEVPASTPFFRDEAAPLGPNTYWVAALGLCGRSDSASVTGERPPDAPGAPAAIAASDTICGAVTVVWSAVAGADSFRLYRDSLPIAAVAGDTAWTDTPPPGSYLYEVEAIGICGAGPRTGDGGIRPPDSISAPLGVAASDTVCGAVRVRWSPVEGAAEYRVLREGAFLAATDTTLLDDSTATPELSLLYSVVAVGRCAESAESDTARGVRPPDPPSPPSGFSATRDRCDGVFLVWSDGEGEEGYLLYRDGALLDSVDAGRTSFLDSTVAAGVPAEYRIAAWNGCTALPEPSAPDTGLAVPPPPPPAGVETDSTCGGVTIRWTDGDREEGYVVVRDSVAIDSLDANGTEYFDGTAAPGVTHLYFVGAFNGCSDPPVYSAAVPGVRPYDAPVTPQILSVTDDLCGGIEVRWSRADHADDYVVYRNGIPIATIPWTDLFHRDLTAAPLALYTYQVAARNWCGASPRSEAAAGIRPADAPPAPGGAAASDTSCQFILVTWNDVANETGFRVYRDGAPSPLAELGPNVTEFRDTDVSSGAHAYRIEAWNGCGSNRSDPVTGERILGFPDSPAGTAATDGGCDDVTITWSYTSGLASIDSFRVSYRVSGGTNWTRLGLVDPGSPLRFVHVPDPGTYDYRVLAFNGCGASAETAGAVDAGTRLGLPGAPAWTEGAGIEVCGGVSFRLEWTAVEGATGYVLVETEGGDEFRLAGTFYETAKSVPGLYRYRVSAEGPCGEGPPTGIRNVEVQAAPAPPAGVAASDDLCGAVEIVWSAGPASDVWIEPVGGERIYLDDAESWVDSLPGGGAREYVLGGWNSCGTLEPSDMVTGSALPIAVPAPDLVDATEGVCDSVVVTWEYPEDALAFVDSFLVDRVRGFNTSVIARLPVSGEARVVDTTGVSGLDYLYRVRALSRCALSAASSDSGRAVGRPGAASWAGVPAGSCAGVPFTLRWEEVPGAAEYEVDREGGPDTVVAGTEASFTLEGTGAHIFVVRAMNGCGAGAPSDPWTVTISDAPSPPAAVSIDTSSCDSVVISWAAQADSVRIYRSGSALPAYAGPGDGRFADRPTALTTYSVRSFNGCGESEGTTVSVSRIRARPAAPVSVIATDAACDSVVVEWAVPPAGAPVDGFQVVRSRSDTTIVVAPSLGPSVRRFTDRSGEGTYVYEVVAFNGCGPSAGEGTSRDEGGFLPSTPRSAFDGRSDSIGCVGGSFTLRWSGQAGVINYRLWETTGGSDRIVALLGGSVDSAVVAAGGTATRTFRIQAVGVCGIGDRSVPFTVEVVASPAAPPLLSATTDRCGDVLLAWGAAPGAASRYRVERDGAPIASVEAPGTGFVDRDVIEGVNYEYRVATENGCGISAPTATVTGRARAGLAAPEQAGPEDGAEGLPIPVRLSWKGVDGAVGYALVVEESDGGGTVVDTALGGATEFAVTRLALGGEYRWRVATRSPCGTGVPTPWRSFTTFGLAPAALSIAPADGEREVDVNVVLRVAFSVPVNDATLSAATLTASGIAVAGSRSLESGGSVLLFAPSSSLSYGVTYLFDFSGLEDIFGRSFAGLAPITFTTRPAERPFGDVDGDYRRDLADVDLALAFLLGESDPSDHPFERIDLNGDGRFTVADLVLLAGVIVREGMSAPAAGGEPIVFEARSFPASEPGETRVVLSFPLPEGGRCGYLEIDMGNGAGVTGVAVPGAAGVDVRHAVEGGRVRVLLLPAAAGAPFARSAAAAPRLEIVVASGAGPERVRLETMTWIGADGVMRSFRSDGGTAVVAREGALLLAPNRPNPFNPTTEIAYYLPAPARIRLVVYDPSGRTVATLREGAEGAGWRSARWDGLTDLGAEAASGVYFARLETGEGVRTVRMLLVR